jgi:hypothetical protein
MPQRSRIAGGTALITATTTTDGTTAGTTIDIGTTGIGRITANPVGQISARLRASHACA